MINLRILTSIFILMITSACIPFVTTVKDVPSSSVTQCTYQVVNRYPHDSKAFTQGLVYFNQTLYEGTGIYGSSSIREVALETGKVLRISKLESQYFGEGITIWKDKLIQLTWKSNQGFVYDLQSFRRIKSFKYPTQGWGLTNDDNHLIMSDGSNALYFLDPNTFKVLKTVYVQEGSQPIEQLNELEYINGEIYANIWRQERIARISPKTGQILGWIDLTGINKSEQNLNQEAVLNGIAYDSKRNRIFVTGKLWSYLFEIKVVC
ncbi:MAG: glutaminyl-peptide cyclotransferase [Calothrix sp. MO_167.B12]|nr:glutaminyl-peptide cyclotransferase [Calothrix sp. MO_167.B12]